MKIFTSSLKAISCLKGLLKELILRDAMRMEALLLLSNLNLPDSWLAGGFVRNLVWDYLHGYSSSTGLNDIDIIYFDAENTSKHQEKKFETEISAFIESSCYLRYQKFSVKNQARMHVINKDKPYVSSCDAMKYWVEKETAVGVRLSEDLEDGELEIAAPLGLQSLFQGYITLNNLRPKALDLIERVEKKRWLQIWPRLELKC